MKTIRRPATLAPIIPISSYAFRQRLRADPANIPPVAPEYDTLKYQFQVLETMLDAYWVALESQINKIRNHPDCRRL